jgi:hypothetical protein
MVNKLSCEREVLNNLFMGVLVEEPEGKNHFEDPRIDGKLTVKWILK